MELLRAGKSYRQIGLHLGISENTVKTYVRSIYRTLRIRSRYALPRLGGGRTSQQSRPGAYVYFIGPDLGGPIKIGLSVTPNERLAGLQTSSHARLRLLGTMPGTREDELRLHVRFASSRLEGEWFESSPELRELIASIAPERST